MASCLYFLFNEARARHFRLPYFRAHVGHVPLVSPAVHPPALALATYNELERLLGHCLTKDLAISNRRTNVEGFSGQSCASSLTPSTPQSIKVEKTPSVMSVSLLKWRHSSLTHLRIGCLQQQQTFHRLGTQGADTLLSLDWVVCELPASKKHGVTPKRPNPAAYQCVHCSMSTQRRRHSRRQLRVMRHELLGRVYWETATLYLR